ncbi:MAG: prepilin-type N-terminal cleavage/methylation domain-containing protein [Candidatus Gracilibacteria bacterium]|jgi:prepilin-type N-terminal cleavage/methylation domain-containing protein
MIKAFLKIRQKIAQKKGFTLVEVLLASFIFTIVGLIAVTIFVNVLRIQKRISLENSLYEDARFMMERISREIRANAVDYEEYYNKLVATDKTYGETYGCYANRFYQPGDKGNGNFKYGSPICSNPPAELGKPDCIIDQDSQDTPTGQNPYAGLQKAADSANAFCDENLQSPVACNSTLNSQPQLYLINPQGTEKTILALKTITLADGSPINALSLLRLAGKDTNNDGIDDDWASCSSDFNCPQGTALEDTLTANISAPYIGFVPISPLRSDITSLEFIVAPLEDPRKAYAETTPDVQQQPHVTVLLTVKPSTTETQNYSGDIPSITLQSTVTSRVYNEVKSFYGRNDGVCPS